jgi:hypothetical protein
MLDTALIHSLPQLAPPVLTVYLDTSPAKARNQGHPPGYRIWLKSRAQVLLKRIPRSEWKHFRAAAKRIEDRLASSPPREKGLAVFAGPKAWEWIPLQVDVEDEMHWGRPSLVQMLWLLDEHQPAGAVVVDRSGARFFQFHLGAVKEREKDAFKIDISQWRKKHMMPPAHPGVHKTRGAERDTFTQRVEAHYEKLYRAAAERIRAWAQREKLAPLFVVGPNEVAEPVWRKLPRALRERSALVKSDHMKLTPAALRDRLDPEIIRWKRAHELAEVSRLLDNPNGSRAVTGVDDTLRRVQQGEARALLVVRGLGGRLRQCLGCGWVDRSGDRVCPACGGERRTVAFRAALPELARRYGVPVEVVAGEAGRKLREAGGVAAWLR